MSITSDWKQKMRDANADLRASTEVPANDFKSRAAAFRDKRAADGPFQKLENKLEHEKHPPRDPAAVAAVAGVKSLGQSEMTHRSVAGRKDEEPATDVEFFEGPEGYIHPIRGTKGYSNKKAGK
jgi:hypothetical protein